jgi:hypothetical protein
MSGIINSAGSKSGVIGLFPMTDPSIGVVRYTNLGTFAAGAAGAIIAIGGSASTQRFNFAQGGGGDTTNYVTGSTNNDLKIVKKGIYIITFSIVAYIVSGEERSVSGKIRGFGSGSTAILAIGNGHVIALDSSTGYTGVDAIYAGLVPANSQINFQTASGSNGNAQINTATSATLTLIREVA